MATGVAGAAVLEIVALILGIFVIGRHGGGPIQGWDNTVGSWWLHHRGPFIGASKVIAWIFDAAELGPIAGILTLVLLGLGLRMRALTPLVAYLGGEFFVFFTRIFVMRPRPPTANYPAPGAIPGIHQTSFSYPSGHSTAGGAVLISLAILTVLAARGSWRWLLAGILAVATLVPPTSRLVLGVHWFSDVAFGLVLGLCWGVLVALTLRDVAWPFSFDLPGRKPTGP